MDHSCVCCLQGPFHRWVNSVLHSTFVSTCDLVWILLFMHSIRIRPSQSLSPDLGTNTALLLKPCRLKLGDSSNFTKTPRQTLSHLYACCCVEHPESSPGHPRPSSSTFKLHTRNSMGLPLLALFQHLKMFPAQHLESFPTDCLLDSETRCPTIHLRFSFIFTETILST